LLPIIGTMDMLSAPPAMITSPMPAMICWLAVAMLCKPLEQKRLTVCPAVVTGIPARSATMRAMFMPCSASGKAQPSTMSSTSFLSMPAAFDHRIDHRRRQLIRPRRAQRALRRLPYRRPCGGNNYSISHVTISSVSL
jgi:hypothetical protein